MSATHLGCGCMISRDTEGLITVVGPCARHRWATQPELETLYQRVLDLRARDAERTRDPEVVYVDEDPETVPLVRPRRS